MNRNATGREAVPRLPRATELALQEAAQRALQAMDGGRPGGAARVLLSTTDRGQLAAELAADGRLVDLFEPECFRYEWLADVLGLCSAAVPPEDAPRRPSDAGEACLESGSVPGKPRLRCRSDPPTDPPYALSAVALRRDGAAEWSRDLLQGFALATDDEGFLAAAVDHPDDQWLGDQLRKWAVTPRALRRWTISAAGNEAATVYLVAKRDLRIRPRDFSSDFAFRDRGQLIRLHSRPGVFSHRRLDLGARRLIEAMQLPAQGRALEIGCGTGAVSLAALVRTPGLHLDAIDSAARAVDCAWQSARLNELQERFAVWLSSCRQLPDTGSYDVVLTNPPYFHQLQIAELFLQTARRALRPGGALWAVGKQAGWYRTHVPRLFDRVQVSERGGGYCIVTGRAP